ncbi:MAG: nitroreductase family protein [Oscillospiraceae bacterium]
MAAGNGKLAAPIVYSRCRRSHLRRFDPCPQPVPEYWVIDCAIAGQNMVLAANALGIGSVWLGTWPNAARIQAQAELFAPHRPSFPIPFLRLVSADASSAAAQSLRPRPRSFEDLKYLNLHTDYG